jgi:hypothetical protein
MTTGFYHLKVYLCMFFKSTGYTEIGGFLMVAIPSALGAQFEEYLRYKAIPNQTSGGIYKIAALLPGLLRKAPFP